MIKSLALSTIRFRFHLKPIINTKRNKLHDIKGFPNYILENEMKWEIFDVLSVYYHLKNNFWNNFSSKSKTQLLTGLILRQPSAAQNLIKRFWMWSRRITKIYLTSHKEHYSFPKPGQHKSVTQLENKSLSKLKWYPYVPYLNLIISSPSILDLHLNNMHCHSGHVTVLPNCPGHAGLKLKEIAEYS